MPGQRLQQPLTLDQVLAAGSDGGGATITDAVWGGTPVGTIYGGTGENTASAGFNALSPLLELGDILYGGISGAGTRLPGNTSATQKFLAQTGTGSVSAAPSWQVVPSGPTIPGSAGYVLLSDGSGAVIVSDVSPTVDPVTGAISAVGGDFAVNASGDVTAGQWEATPVQIPYGGTGANAKTPAFNALSPMSAVGDLIYGGTSGSGTRLAPNTSATLKLLTETGTGSAGQAPAWDTLTAIIDAAIGSTEGAILVRGASAWQLLDPSSSSGYVLTSNGTGAVPTYQAGGGGGGSPGGSSGDIQYNNSGSFGGDTATTDGSGNLTMTSSTIDSFVLAQNSSYPNYLNLTDGHTAASVFDIGAGDIFLYSEVYFRGNATFQSANLTVGGQAIFQFGINVTGPDSSTGTALLVQNWSNDQILYGRDDGLVETLNNTLDNGDGQAIIQSLSVVSALSFGLGGQIAMLGDSINMYNGTGSSGGNILMDAGSILNLAGLSLNEGFPTSPGASGTVYNSLGILMVSP